MHWYKNHMPRVIESQKSAGEGRGASKYIAQIFDPSLNDSMSWDGVAQLWVANPPPPSSASLSSEPKDTFEASSEPYFGWPTKEYVVIDGSSHLNEQPLTLNTPFPSTRSGFFRVNYLVASKSDVDYDAFYRHWLEVHVPNISDWMGKSNGFRYLVNHSLYPKQAPYAGMAELYFHNEEDWKQCRSLMQADGMESYMDMSRLQVLFGNTEMVGIP